jgi:hypothetical protein
MVSLLMKLAPDGRHMAFEPRDVYDFLADHRYDLRTPHGFLRGKDPLSFGEYTSAQQCPFEAIRFVATPQGALP